MQKLNYHHTHKNLTHCPICAYINNIKRARIVETINVTLAVTLMWDSFRFSESSVTNLPNKVTAG